MKVEQGSFHPLGASWDGRGVNFALFSEHATSVELCLFDDGGAETRVAVPWRSVHVWHLHVPGLKPGQRYGWRVHGPYAPLEGHRYNARKLLLDPYAEGLAGAIDVRGPVYGYPRDRGFDDLVFDDRDDASAMVKGVVVDRAFEWGDDAPPGTSWHDTVLYELHVKGFTRRHPGVPEALRGTFLGLASDAAIAHLRSLGVTAVELMPVHERLDEPAVVARGLTNYWGYSTLAFFAADRRFATGGGDAAREFKEMVRRLHSAGIEVILDVVYNHTCEGDETGPTVGFRGIDNRVYYRLESESPRDYVDFSGCGNTLDLTHPQVLKLVTDSLRFWVTEMHVDGFRFDLAPALVRGAQGAVDRLGVFFSVMHQDPVLSRIKLIAEPWDVGHGGYQVGNFPVLWREWNGRFRDTVRRFWRGDRKAVADLGFRLTGSSDLFADDGRHPHASINFVTAHDGFTLRDLVSYERKHNLANGERNADGLDDNESQNCGVEGETDDAAVLAYRRTIARSVLATLLVSHGVPMISMGDEAWRTQGGNNNPYCQDSELTWLDWAPTADASSMGAAARSLLALRSEHPVFRRRGFLRGAPSATSRGKDITWLRTDGTEMGASDWADPKVAALAYRLDGDALELDTATPAGPADDSFLVLMNGEPAASEFTLPPAALGESWRVVFDGCEPPQTGARFVAGQSLRVAAGGLVVLMGA